MKQPNRATISVSSDTKDRFNSVRWKEGKLADAFINELLDMYEVCNADKFSSESLGDRVSKLEMQLEILLKK